MAAGAEGYEVFWGGGSALGIGGDVMDMKPSDIGTTGAATLPSIPALNLSRLRSCGAPSARIEAYAGVFPFVEFCGEELEEFLVGPGGWDDTAGVVFYSVVGRAAVARIRGGADCFHE